jgi:hypothetical protein
MKIDTAELRAFILEASRATYASGDESIKETQADGSTTIEYKSGDYRFHDNYFGGEPYGGREVVFLNDKPIWMMVYYGLVYEGGIAKDIYPFLMESLSKSILEMPYRGPTSYESGSYRYENELEGTVERLSGSEKICKGDICIYEAKYIGGLVDR